jgi:hypothetical protein
VPVAVEREGAKEWDNLKLPCVDDEGAAVVIYVQVEMG